MNRTTLKCSTQPSTSTSTYVIARENHSLLSSLSLSREKTRQDKTRQDKTTKPTLPHLTLPYLTVFAPSGVQESRTGSSANKIKYINININSMSVRARAEEEPLSFVVWNLNWKLELNLN